MGIRERERKVYRRLRRAGLEVIPDGEATGRAIRSGPYRSGQ
ncbi:hypothetical protein ACFY15_16840 [Streptomyces sp. NPDC001373]